MKLAIQIVLWLAAGVLVYLIYDSINGPIEFNKLKRERYAKVIDRMKDIRAAELAYKDVTGRFAGSFDELITFVDTARFTITQRRDTTVLDVEMTKAYGVDQYKEKILIDTLGYRSVKDSLFGDSEDYRNMMWVPTTERSEKFELDAGFLTKDKNKIPVFEAKVAKEVILKDQPQELVMQEKQIVSVDAVDGAYITVGAMDEINTNGNWPTFYGGTEE
jgi:hypothetical protein